MTKSSETFPGVGEVSSPAQEVTLSQNETESLCMKAARGAGFSWGLAEEAGIAAGWLAARGMDGTASLLAWLAHRQGQRAKAGRPEPSPGHWRGAGQGPLCPITLGAALMDSALLADGPFSRDTRLDPVGAPILLLPFLVRGAQICGKSLAVVWPGGRMAISRQGAFDRRAALGRMGRDALALTIQIAPDPDPESLPAGSTRLPAIPMAVLTGLDLFALRTTVPATDASRRGAGSNTTDND